MAITAKEFQEQVIAWYNDNPHGAEVSSFDDALQEFIDSVASKWSVEKYGTKSATIEAGKVVSVSDSANSEDTHNVFEINGQFFKVVGSYSSWDGIDWDYAEAFEVEPEEVTVTVYKRKR